MATNQYVCYIVNCWGNIIPVDYVFLQVYLSSHTGSQEAINAEIIGLFIREKRQMIDTGVSYQSSYITRFVTAFLIGCQGEISDKYMANVLSQNYVIPNIIISRQAVT